MGQLKRLKLRLTVEQQLVLRDMLEYFILTESMRSMYKLEYYVLVEWYHRHIRRFLFVTDKPFSLSWAEGCALWRVMGVHGWNSHREAMHGREAMRRDAMHRISTATAILWQIDKYFAINN